MEQFILIYCKYRIENKDVCRQKIKDNLPASMATALTYINELNHSDKPNYQMIKLWFAFNEEDEQKAFRTKLKTNKGQA